MNSFYQFRVQLTNVYIFGKVLKVMKTLTTALAILFSLGLAIPAFAADSTPSTTRKDLIKEKVETRKEVTQTKQTTIQNLKEQMATREAALKLKLKAFRDKKKATVAERVSTNLNNINAQRTAQMTKTLSTMSSILTRLETRVNSATPDIKDPAAAKLAIANAKAAIASAQSSVTTQSQKDYTLTISSETKAKQEAQTTRDQLQSDLKTTRATVIAAKQAVINVIRVAKGQGVTKEGT